MNCAKWLQPPTSTTKLTLFNSIRILLRHPPPPAPLKMRLASFCSAQVRLRIGGLVTARSVKYLGKLASKLSDQETRDGWWSEVSERSERALRKTRNEYEPLLNYHYSQFFGWLHLPPDPLKMRAQSRMNSLGAAPRRSSFPRPDPLLLVRGRLHRNLNNLRRRLRPFNNRNCRGRPGPS